MPVLGKRYVQILRLAGQSVRYAATANAAYARWSRMTRASYSQPAPIPRGVGAARGPRRSNSLRVAFDCPGRRVLALITQFPGVPAAPPSARLGQASSRARASARIVQRTEARLPAMSRWISTKSRELNYPLGVQDAQTGRLDGEELSRSVYTDEKSVEGYGAGALLTSFAASWRSLHS